MCVSPGEGPGHDRRGPCHRPSTERPPWQAGSCVPPFSAERCNPYGESVTRLESPASVFLPVGIGTCTVQASGATIPSYRMGKRSAAALLRRENGTLEVGKRRSAPLGRWRAGVRVKAGHRRVAGIREAVAVEALGVGDHTDQPGCSKPSRPRFAVSCLLRHITGSAALLTGGRDGEAPKSGDRR